MTDYSRYIVENIRKVREDGKIDAGSRAVGMKIYVRNGSFSRACLKIACCEMLSQFAVCLLPNSGGVVGYVDWI